jgi:HEAT repeat protein
VKASGALRVAHTDEAFQGLSESLNQADGRVRLQVVEDIGGFYRPESLALTKEILKNEKNPEIVCRAIGNLGRYNDEDSRELLIGYLKTESYRNKLAQAAVAAIRMLDDGSYIRPLMEIARQREQEFIYNDYTCVLDALAYIARNEDDKTEVRQFISDYVNHPKRCIQIGAITALGTLGDPKSIPVVETFASDERGDRVQRAAKDSLEKLSREKKIVPEEIVLLRETVAQLKEDNKKIKTDLEDLKKRFEAKEDPNDCKESTAKYGTE